MVSVLYMVSLALYNCWRSYSQDGFFVMLVSLLNYYVYGCNDEIFWYWVLGLMNWVFYLAIFIR